MIDADALKKEWHLGDVCETCGLDTRQCGNDYCFTRMDVCGMIDDAPTVGWLMNAAEDGPPTEEGWYLVYAPDYLGGSRKEHINGYMFAQWNGKTWSVERCVYQKKGCVKAWMTFPDLTEGGVDQADDREGEDG